MKNQIKKIFFMQMPLFISMPAFIWQMIFLWIPLIFLVGMSVFVKNGGITLTLAPYASILNSMHFWVITRSLFLSSITTIICVVVAYPVAYYVARRIKRGKTIFLFFLSVPFWVNFLIHIYAWFFVLDSRGIINSILMKMGIISVPLHLLNSAFAICLVTFYCYLPFMILPIYTALERLDGNLFEAASDLGASPRITFRTITVPLTLTGIRSGVFLVFVASFGEYAIPVLMGGGKKLYVGSLISDYFLLSQEQALGSAFTVFSSIILLIMAILIHFILSKKVLLKGAYW